MTKQAKTASPPRPRLMLVTRNLPPLLGGMERLNLHIASELLRDFELLIVGPTGCASRLPSASVVYEVPHKPLWRFLSSAFLRVLRLSREYQVRCVIAGSGLTAPMALIGARICGARSAVYVHGLDLVAPHPVYRWIWRPILRRMDLCIANSSYTAGLAASIGIPNETICVLNPGLDLPDPEDPSTAADFRKSHGLHSRKVMLSVGRLTPRKGLLEFVREALPAIVAVYPDAILVIIGDEAPDALVGGGAGMGNRIVDLARSKGLSKNVCLLGPCDDLVLSAAYQTADVLVFPVRDVPGDVEGFGMVAIEAASHGLQTVAFAVGGIGDAVADGHSGWLVTADDYLSLVERIIQVLTQGRSTTVERRCRDFSAALAWPHFGIKLRALINRLLKSRPSPARA
ncbi:MAG: glycosyltransferase family 4 protein [Woeseia sp.]